MFRLALTMALWSFCAVVAAQPPPDDPPPQEPDAPDAPPDAPDAPGGGAPSDDLPPSPQPPPAYEVDLEPADERPVPHEPGTPRTEPAPQVPDDEEGGLRVSLGGRAGYAVQPDQWVAGPHLTLRGIFADFVRLDTMVLLGMATEHWTLRVSAHLSLVLSAGDFRFFPLVGPAGIVHRPRGGFAEWCDKLQLECGDSAFGMELGLGAGWRALGVQAYLSTGDLPLLTVLGSVTLEL